MLAYDMVTQLTCAN